jgi:formylglycine-generating enzyme required for sulfatase activity
MSPRTWCCLVALPTFLLGLGFVRPGGSEPSKPKKPPRQIKNSLGMKLVLIPPGKFKMGSPKDEADALANEGPQHEVEITRAFYLGETEVTQAQFKKVMGYNPSYFSTDGKGKEGAKFFDFSKPGGGKDRVKGMDTDAFPVENVSWQEAQTFLKKLSELPEEKKKGRKYRLPTEAEWEYAARGGAPSYQVFGFGNSLSSQQANFKGNYPYGGAAKGPYLGRTCKVGSYPANGFGLRDMHGNVDEWCQDWYGRDYYGKSPRRDPPGPAKGSDRVVRGGCWSSHAGLFCRSASRNDCSPAVRTHVLGFRVALVASGG